MCPIKARVKFAQYTRSVSICNIELVAEIWYWNFSLYVGIERLVINDNHATKRRIGNKPAVCALRATSST